MASGEKHQADFEQIKKMYQAKQNAVGIIKTSNCNTVSRDALPAQMQNNASGVHAPYPARLPSLAPLSVPLRTIIDKRTYEQVFRDELKNRHKIVYIKSEQKIPVEPPTSLEPGPSCSERQGNYTTTIYNITSHDVSSRTVNVPVKAVHPMPTLSVFRPSIPKPQPTMEVISYQKSQPDAYAKRLLEITKSGMKHLEMPSSSGQNSRPTISYRSPNAIQPTNSIVRPMSQGVINPQQLNIKSTIGPKTVRTYTYGSADEKEIYRRIQAQQERRKAPIPSLETFAQNGEAVRISKHRSNIMVSIINPKVSPPAPVHVYDAPAIVRGKSHNSTERFQRLDFGSSTSVQIHKERNNVSAGLTEPPPAHKNMNDHHLVATFPNSTTALAKPQSCPNELLHYSQDQVLNLDTKHNASRSGHVSVTSPIVVRSPSTTDASTKLITRPETIPKEKESIVPVSESFSTDLPQPNSGLSSTPLPAPPTILSPVLLGNQPQNHNIQQLLAHLGTIQQHSQQQSAANITEPTQLDDKLSMLLKHAKTAIAFEASQHNLTKIKSPSKRKNTLEEGDPSRKRKPKPKFDGSTEPFLQNEPCYKVSSRLSRCRECGRSAATRSRHALNIFCRFFAFRKLKYNEIGKLEVVGFADPYLDPNEADISLWSSNLKQVPVDLSIEKSKFLLGQVGYKFCDLFHQEREAHFEHLSADKTIAWKQAVQGVREMCDVCQTTLFNHHWVCSYCGFVVCIDCYKCRKQGIITTESSTKDKDAHGWLLCSSTKEPHGQDRLMLTQIIPSNCLYKLVRQMHGVCALLEIPLNCVCPLSKEPLFQKIKDKFEFIYPITVPGKTEQEEICYDVNDPNSAPCVTRMVSITIKKIEQVTPGVVEERPQQHAHQDGAITCQIEFSKQFHDDDRQPVADPLSCGASAVESGSDDMTNDEKQSYSFIGFQNEIRTDGDHFDESLYKLTVVEKKDSCDLKRKEASEQTGEANATSVVKTESAAVVKIERANPSENGCAAESRMEAEFKVVPMEDTACATISSSIDVNMGNGKVNSAMTNSNAGNDAYRLMYDTQMDTSAPAGSSHGVEDTPNKQIIKPKCVTDQNGVPQTAAGDTHGANPISVKPEMAARQETSKDSIIQPLPYSEEGRFKPSPPVDATTIAMILKQMVKFDKTVNIFSTFERHMVHDGGPLDDFVEHISVKAERVRGFLDDFLKEFVFLRGSNSSDDLTNERHILEYNRQIKDGLKFRNKSERRMHLDKSSPLYPEVGHEWLCGGKLLRLLDPLDVRNYQPFHDQWERGQPVMVSSVSSKMNMDLWIPESFGRDFGEQLNDLVNCFNGKIVRGHPMKVFWSGFEQIRERLLDERERPMMLKLKDWPPGDDFAEMMPTRFYDLMKSLPLAEYTRREGRLNLASRLNSFFVRPDLGPKMYSAYGSALHPNKGTTNLHLDMSDAVNVMVYVGIPTDVPRARYNEKILEVIETEDCDYLTRERIRERKEQPGALWHIYHAQDADKIRQLLNKIELERGGMIKANHDPIHDQKWYLDRNMRRRLQLEYGVEGYAIVQCSGDAIFIPAGAPHQVRNLHNCIKVAEDFVSPENISYCFKLTNEFRHLSKTHSNHEDKLQIKNIIYHTVKDAVSSITNPLIMMAGEGNPGVSL